MELNPLHIRLARRFFGIGRRQARLVHADAVKWVREYRGPAVDLIVDDIFGDASGEPKRAVTADRRWCSRLRSLLSPGGVLVMTFATRAEMDSCACIHDPVVRKQFGSAFRLNKPQYENTIAAFLTGTSTSRELRRNLAREPGLNPGVKSSRLDYRIRRIG